MSNYYPSNDDQLDDWMANFITVLSIHLADFSMVEADVTPLETAQGLFSTAVANYLTKKAECASASSGKSMKRDDMIELLRPLVQRINHHPGMTNEIRSALGLPVREEMIHTMASAGEEVPGIYLESLPGRIVVHFGTEPQNERINGKPSWARGCNIYRKKVDETSYHLVVFETSSPYIDIIEGPASDYMYIAQYRGARSTVAGVDSTPATIASSGRIAA